MSYFKRSNYCRFIVHELDLTDSLDRLKAASFILGIFGYYQIEIFKACLPFYGLEEILIRLNCEKNHSKNNLN